MSRVRKSKYLFKVRKHGARQNNDIGKEVKR
nr:MAG TPA: hypothetical protein [Caudoviricetes sp.]